MAAIDLFNRVLRDLTAQDRQALAGLITAARENLLAARSEDASLRLAEDFSREVLDMSRPTKR